MTITLVGSPGQRPNPCVHKGSGEVHITVFVTASKQLDGWNRPSFDMTQAINDSERYWSKPRGLTQTICQ